MPSKSATALLQANPESHVTLATQRCDIVVATQEYVDVDIIHQALSRTIAGSIIVTMKELSTE